MALPLKTKSQLAAKTAQQIRKPLEVRGPISALGGSSLAYSEWMEDFFPASGGSLLAPLATAKTGANSVAGAFVNDADGGEFTITTTADNEAQTNRLDFGDQLVFDIAKIRSIEFRLKADLDATGTSDTLGTGDNIVFGVAADHNATLDSNTLHAWFRVIGDADGDLDILWESDDGTTDDDDNDTGSDLPEGQYFYAAIDFTNGLGAVQFLLSVGANDTDVPVYSVVGEADMSSASGNVQPYIFLSKAAAANEDHTLSIDAVRVVYGR